MLGLPYGEKTMTIC